MRYLLLLALLPTAAFADDTRVTCPQGSCKVLVLTPEEENVLVGKNGILDTAGAARALDLGNIVSYFRTKIATAPAGDPRAPEKAQDKPAVDTAPAAAPGVGK